jgi:hypothetical protein
VQLLIFHFHFQGLQNRFVKIEVSHYTTKSQVIHNCQK